jgi:hypothetical protein
VLDHVPPTERLALDDWMAPSGLPITLRALLGARIDALAADAKTVIRVAAVVGVSFGESVVSDVIGEQVEGSVFARLAEASLIVPLEAKGQWRFGHPLIHDAAYAGLLGSTRRTLHAKVADLLEARTGRGAIGAVARHRLAAGDDELGGAAPGRGGGESLSVGATAERGVWTAAAELGVARSQRPIASGREQRSSDPRRRPVAQLTVARRWPLDP